MYRAKSFEVEALRFGLYTEEEATVYSFPVGTY